jgi:hypothetical protein
VRPLNSLTVRLLAFVLWLSGIAFWSFYQSVVDWRVYEGLAASQAIADGRIFKVKDETSHITQVTVAWTDSAGTRLAAHTTARLDFLRRLARGGPSANMPLASRIDQATVAVKYTVDPTKPDLDKGAALIVGQEDVVAGEIERRWWGGAIASGCAIVFLIVSGVFVLLPLK